MKNSSTNNIKISKRYAAALSELRLDYKIYEDLLLVKNTMESSIELWEFINNPQVDSNIKKETIHRIFEWKVEQEILNLLYLLIDKKRISVINPLANSYRELYFSKSNIQLAELSSPSVISKEDLDAIKSTLEGCFHKEVSLDSNVDESLIAGLKLKLGSKVIDSSVKAKLEELKARLQ